MFARVTSLRYWKSEHREETCQDQLLDNIGAGLFAVADGASTSSSPQLWANVLVKQFLDVPLLSDHPFEVDWWVRMAQERYISERPNAALLSPLAREKENTQGSESTLVTLRIASVDEAAARGELLVLGDSCVLIGRPDTQQVTLTYPLDNAADFDQHPICFPSTPGSFSRQFHLCKRRPVDLAAGDIVMLATDAVSRWIIGKGRGQYPEMWEAFQTVAQQTPTDWATFIQQQRQNKTMLEDDDCTAMVIDLQADTFSTLPAAGQDTAPAMRSLGTTTRHQQQVIDERARRFQQARTDQNRELEAIYYGDGIALETMLLGQITLEEIEHARQVSDALRAVISASTANYNKPDFAPKMREIWERYKEVLLDEPCAEGIRATLRANGVLSPTAAGNRQPLPAAQPLPGAPALSENTVPASTVPAKQAAPALPSAGYRAIVSPQADPQAREAAVQGALLRLYQAIEAGNDQQILALAAEVERLGGTPAPKQAEDIRLARQRQKTISEFQTVLQGGTPRQIADAYKAAVALPNWQITDRDMERVDLAHSFIAAFYQDDDDAIRAAVTALERYPDPQFLRLVPEQSQRIKHIQDRSTTLAEFRQAVASQRIETIGPAYERLQQLGRTAVLSSEERELGAFALSLRQALAQQQEEVLAAAFAAWQQSGHEGFFSLAAEDYARLWEAQQVMAAQRDPTAVAFTINGEAISGGFLKQVKSLKRHYLALQIRNDEQAIIADRAQEMRLRNGIDQWQAELNSPLRFHQRTQEELMDDTLIRQAIEQDVVKRGGFADFTLAPELETTHQAIKNGLGQSRYLALLREQDLNDEDAWHIVAIFVRRHKFPAYFSTVSTLSFEQWLQEQRKQARITTQDAAARPANKKPSWKLWSK